MDGKCVFVSSNVFIKILYGIILESLSFLNINLCQNAIAAGARIWYDATAHRERKKFHGPRTRFSVV